MEEIDNFWEEIKFEVGILGKTYGDTAERKVLVGSGNREGKILFIGDDPDLYQNEDLKVAPSSSGEFLIKLCDIEGIEPENYYITTLAKRDCKFSEFMDEEKEQLKELLNMQIALIKPKIIVALGAEVAENLLGRDVKLGEERGKILEWIGGIKLFITYDVNFVKKSRNEDGKKSRAALEFWNDLKILKQELDKIDG
ncbi:MAG: uracil-DNA glycosylase [Candidatus Fusobacterium pullicola]|uniref:Uracil-DNA glycosylase n=1 Tax=Candidatus Fusobacterium pullicola TaxID=2838601 RepID=A0A9E2KZD6_9FUSO|nr:uracil-DNA glycosylase family protein [uncultured Fusobacterium sp.]MBM6690254.1 uracil-DNA glycosylase [Fusobacterium mortiferum]MBU3842692.1 uracil-DNA glycosylase [Candidatus Fusobacterium pullicola]